MRHKDQTNEAITRNFKNHILPYFSDKDVQKITVKDIIDWQNKILENDFSNSFNNSLYSNFSSFMNYCTLNHYLTENLVLKVGNFPKKNEIKKQDYYTPREFRKFIKCVDDYIYKEYFIFMFHYGPRPSEALAMRFCDIENSFIYICHSLQRRGTRKLDTPKNKSSIRYLKLSILTRFRIFRLRCFYEKYSEDFSEEYFIFGGDKPLSTSTIERRLTEACEKAKIRRITPHDMRHSYATNEIHSGTSIDEVSQNLGHSKTSMTVDTYLHTKRRVPRSTLQGNIFNEVITRNFKKISQSIITFFM